MLTDHASRRATFYRQLAGLENAGVAVRQALPKVRASGADLAALKRHLQEAVDHGVDLGRAFADAPNLQPFERQLMASAVQVGRLSETWTELAEYFENKAQMRREVISQLSHPVIVLHVAIFLPALYLLFTEGPAAYFKTTLPPFLVLWAVILGLPRLLRACEGSALLDALLWCLPVASMVYRASARRTALSVLRASLGAGLIADAAFAAAGKACPAHGLRRQLLHAAEEARAGQPLPLIVERLTLLPVAVRDGMATAAESGSLPETIQQLERQMAEDARLKLKIALQAVGVLAFLAVAAVVAVKVVGFWTGYYGNMMKGQ